MKILIIIFIVFFAGDYILEFLYKFFLRKLVVSYKFSKAKIDFNAISPLLIDKGYMTRDHQVAINFCRLDSEFKSAFPQYSNDQFKKIENILQMLKDTPHLGGGKFIQFSRKEIKKAKAEKLVKAIKDAGLKFDARADEYPLDILDRILLMPSLYERFNKKIDQKRANNFIYKKKLEWLLEATSTFRDKKNEELDEYQAYFLMSLNRIVLELSFSGLCPTLFKKMVMEWVEALVVALILATILRSYLMQPFKIPSGSMRPTLLEDSTYDFFGHKLVIGDHIFVDKWTYGPQVLQPMFWDIAFKDDQPPFLSLRWPDALLPLTKMRLPGLRKPQTGDIVVFVYPGDPTKDFIKRLIAVGGDTVEIKDGFVYVNNKKITDPRLTKNYYYNRGDYGAQAQVVHVPPGYDFVMGDNSNSSYDSRYWGFVPETSIIGKADFIFFPFDRIRILQ